ncbi:hypothetical protein ACI3KY_19750 [Microbacterium sp. ZW T2_14]|uniref:hypothetical protein n=1 Tax=Microbacterium sp. ZW T2_14 TaxID=3378079 RepID=UPI003854CBAA
MTSTTAASSPPAVMPLIGHYFPEILSLARRGLVWAVLYGAFARASRGGCLPASESVEPVCYNATLGPSPLTWFLMALVFVVALGSAAKATRTAVINRTLRIAATALWAVPLLAALLALASFLTASPDTLTHGSLGSVSVEITSE